MPLCSSVGIACLFVVQALNGGEQTWAASLPLFIAYFLLPVLFGRRSCATGSTTSS